MTKCDLCDAEVAEPIEVRQPRPSDPSDMCCIMAGCEACFPKGQCARTGAEWDQYIESPEAIAAGHMWLS